LLTPSAPRGPYSRCPRWEGTEEHKIPPLADASSGSSSHWLSHLSPLFIDGDIEIGTAYVISDSSHAFSNRLPGKTVKWMDKVESSYEVELSDQPE
jgi:hypothetical protein